MKRLPGRAFRARRSVSVAALHLFVVSAASGAEPPAEPPPKPVEEAETDDTIVPPRLVFAPSIPYPAGASGDAVVVLALTVTKTGTVRSVHTISGEEPFVAAAVGAAPSFQFAAATRGGRAISATIRFEVTFHEPAKAANDARSAPPAPPEKKPTPVVTPPSEEPAEVTVHGRRAEPMASSLSRAEVRQLPGAFGDPFRAIEGLPGVTPIVSGLPFFYVRGAPPGNVGYFLDGVRVPYLYHVGLGPSVIHPGMVDSVELYPGGYPAQFGRFAGGIVSGVTTVPRDDLHGEANLRLLDVGALAETGFAGGRGTILIGGRYSYTAAILSLVAKDIELDYRDYQVRATYDFTPRDRIGVFAFGSYDLLGQKTDGVVNILFGSEFHRVDLRYDHTLPRGGNLRIASTLGFDQTRIAEQRNATDRITGARLELVQPLSDAVTLRAGADMMLDGYGTSQPYYFDPDDPASQRYNRLFAPRDDLAFGGYADAVFTLGRIEVTPGVRFDVFRSAGASATSVEPRISARLRIAKHVRLVEAYGLMHQPPSFVVPVPGLSPATLSGGLQRAIQTSAGAEVDFPAQTTMKASLFHNAFYNMTDALASAAAVSGGLLRGLEVRSTGQAIGFELYVKRPLTAQLGGSLSYTLSRSIRNIGNATFPSAFDRTHVATLALGYDLGKNWRAGTRFVFYSGVPKTQPSRGLIVPPPALYPGRDPSFFRLDLRLEKRWTIGSRGYLSLVFEVLNATLSKETIAGTTIGPVTIPSIGLEGGF